MIITLVQNSASNYKVKDLELLHCAFLPFNVITTATIANDIHCINVHVNIWISGEKMFLTQVKEKTNMEYKDFMPP